MTLEELKRNLKYEMDKHKNDKVDTCDTNISAMCRDILGVLEAMEKELSELPNEYSEKLYKIAYDKGRADERTKVVDEYTEELKTYLRKFSVKTISDKDFDYVADTLKKRWSK